MKQALVMAAVGILSTLVLDAPLRAGATDGRLDIYWNDTEGGAATLIVTPAGESVLIDSGNPGGRDAARIVDAATKLAGLKQIDFLITTHYHLDHFGGAAEVAARLPIRVVYDNGEFPGGFERPSKEYLAFPAERRVLNPGDTLPLAQRKDGAPIAIRCVAARQQFVAPRPSAKENPSCAGGKKKLEDRTDNANSIATLLSFGPFRFFDAGDLTWNMEAKLACPVDLVGPVDVYQVTHHGLDVSNNPVLVRTLSPRVAVMGNGSTKGCSPETFATLKSIDGLESIYQLHRNLRPDGQTNNVAAEFIANEKSDTDGCDGNHIKLSVDPAGKTYTVTIPATKHEQTYSTTMK